MTKNYTIIFSFLYLFPSIGNFSFSQKKLFEFLPSSTTNITFNNKIVDTKAHNILIYSNYYGGAGVGVGDFNNDGLLDIFFSGNLVRDELYLNKGEFKFEEITDRAGIRDNGGWSSGVVVADINNDGWQDIYITRELYDDKPELRKNKLYINNQDLTFTESSAEYKVDHNGRTRHATFLDYDKDGWLDLLLLTQPPNTGNYSTMLGTDLELPEYAPVLLRNTGKGYFENKSEGSDLDVPGFPNSVSASDFNHDGWVDLYISNDFKAPDKLYLNQKDGTFKNIINTSMGHITYFSMGVDVADINNDGWMDISILDMAAEDNYRSKSNMSGMNPQTFWDIVNQGGHYQYMYNSLQLNNGVMSESKNRQDGISFSDIAQISGTSSTDWSWSNLIADLDNDGKKDIYITNGLLRDIRNTDGDKKVGQYISQVIYDHIKSNPQSEDVNVWDILDLDKALDILPSEPLPNYAYKNQTGINFINSTVDWGLGIKSFSNGSAVADLNNDGALDLIVNNINNEAFIFKNNTNEVSENNYLRVSLQDELPIFGCRVSITTEEGQQWYEYTSVRGMYSCSEQVAHFGLGQVSLVDELVVYWNDGKITKYSQVEANQHLHINRGEFGKAVRKSPTIQKNFKRVNSEKLGLVFTHQENEYDDYSKQVLLPHKMSQFGPALAVGDVNGDGMDDVYFGGALSQPSSLLIQNPDGTFRSDQNEIWKKESMYEDIDATFFDFDSDGDLDLYVVSGGNKYIPDSKIYQDRLFRNNGEGSFERYNQVLPIFYESGSCVRSFDYDQDGDMDLFVGGRHKPGKYPEPVTSRLLLNNGGVFQDITESRAPGLVDIGMVTDAIWTDFDEDGLVDLLLVGEWMPITLIRNKEGNFYNATKEFNLSRTTGWWNSIEEGDADGDGDVDYVLGNLGLNYKYKATEEEPFEVYYEDFDNNGQKDIVLSYYNFGKKYPLRGRSCSAQQIQEIGQKFKTYNMFASANLYDVYGEKELSRAVNYKAQTFAHINLENRGKGKFEINILPEYSQISSLNDMIVYDFNGDGELDVLAVGNNFSSEIETPRNDAGKGVLLLNNGKSYESIMPSKSGFYVPQDSRKLAFMKIRNSKHVIVVSNNGSLQLFEVLNQEGKNAN